jgi:hypothetical protein
MSGGFESLRLAEQTAREESENVSAMLDDTIPGRRRTRVTVTSRAARRLSPGPGGIQVELPNSEFPSPSRIFSSSRLPPARGPLRSGAAAAARAAAPPGQPRRPGPESLALTRQPEIEK